MRNTLTKTLPLLAVAGLLLTGCGSSDEVDSMDDLVAAWEDHTGETCKPDDNTADEYRTCSDGSLLNYYDDPDELQERVAFLEELWTTADIGNKSLVGDTWIINVTPDDEYPKLQKVLGGEIMDFNTN